MVEKIVLRRTSFGALADDGAFQFLLPLDAFRKHCYISLMINFRDSRKVCWKFYALGNRRPARSPDPSLE
ncbi:hypothetical protein GJAV_G00022460 [Gymnothorax javanicus]|nr:hypothetical protein GJAV_G00022460 [Gymnothorax javanicus]